MFSARFAYFPLLFAFLLGPAQVCAQVDWAQQINGNGSNLNDVAFLSTTQLVAVGQGGTVIYSTDGGMNWNDGAGIGAGDDLLSLSFSGSTIVAVGKNGRVVRSLDVGVNWTEENPAAGPDLNRAVATFIDNSIVVAVGKKDGTAFTVFRSTDSGDNWTQLGNPNVPTSGGKNLNAVAFSGDIGVAVGDKNGGNFTFLRTIDKGLNWTQINLAGGNDLYAVSFVTPLDVVAVGKAGVAAYSSDAGATWTKVAPDPSAANLNYITFSGNNVVAAGTQSGGFNLIYSQDKGATWNTATVNGGAANNINALASSSSIMAAVGNGGTILESTDGGANWNAQTSGVGTDLVGVDIVNPMIVVGDGGVVLLKNSQAASGGGSGGGFSGDTYGSDAYPIDVPFGGEWLFALFVAGYGLYRLRS
jgi:photosystem II stability/assembly factor-like uncharacterized protein